MPDLNIVFTRKADKDELKIYQYISEAFGEVYATKFRSKLINLFYTLTKHPYIGRICKNDRSLRVIIISKQNKIVYKVTDKNIVIIRILNNKTDVSRNF